MIIKSDTFCRVRRHIQNNLDNWTSLCDYLMRGPKGLWLTKYEDHLSVFPKSQMKRTGNHGWNIVVRPPRWWKQSLELSHTSYNLQERQSLDTSRNEGTYIQKRTWNRDNSRAAGRFYELGLLYTKTKRRVWISTQKYKAWSIYRYSLQQNSRGGFSINVMSVHIQKQILLLCHTNSTSNKSAFWNQYQ